MTTTDSATTDVLALVTGMTAALHEGDLDAVLAAYEDAPAVVFTPGAPAATSTQEVRAAFAGLLGLRPQFSYRGHDVVVAGDIALHLAPWTMTGTAADGTAVEDSGLSVAVLRRQGDGSWRLVIDHPSGDALLARD